MNDNIRIRRANLEDATSLVVLSEQLGYITSVEEIQARLSKLQEMHEHVVYVAVSQDDDVVGWIHGLVSHRLVTETFVELGGLVVAEGYRSQGIGDRLLRKVEEWAVEMGLNTVRIRARSSRERAHRFYTRMGYQLFKDQKVFERLLEDEE